jgi:hypothetical protein
MDLKLALTDSAAGHFWLAALLLLAVKLIATAMQLAMAHGEYRVLPTTALFRAVYWTGKITPAFAAGCASVSAILLHDRGRGFGLGCLSLAALFLAFYVVRLRKQGRFFGGIEAFSRRRT